MNMTLNWSNPPLSDRTIDGECDRLLISIPILSSSANMAFVIFVASKS
ncbi:hypothetical protein [Moorena producens]|nr:hypothetical protein [Moorena producens]